MPTFTATVVLSFSLMANLIGFQNIYISTLNVLLLTITLGFDVHLFAVTKKSAKQVFGNNASLSWKIGNLNTQL